MAEPHTPTLSRNNQLVLDMLSNAARPLSAYQLLDRLRPEGLRAPPQIYRALKWLADHGLVHKLESTNSFVACTHARYCAGEKCSPLATLFFLCDECGSAEEIGARSVSDYVNDHSDQSGFQIKNTTLEVHGTCAGCLSG